MHPSRKPLMAANWKMYKTISEGETFIQELAKGLQPLLRDELPDIVVCPPFTALYALSQKLQQASLPGVALGAQNMESAEEGAYTGEIAAVMLKECDVCYVLIGHSERRQYYNETDGSVNAKVKAALQAGLIPVVCVGESLQQREAGETDAWVQQQVKAALQDVSAAQQASMVFAYEPIWAIGTGRVCEAEEANRVIGLIRQTVQAPSCRILYGGSVKPDNVLGLMAQPEIDGGLVGGASLQPDSFLQLIQAAMPAKV